MGIFLTLAAFLASWHYSRRSLGAGMAAVLTAGYFYGIVRANFLDGFSFFLYDAAVSGLYLARLTLPNSLAPRNATELTTWVRILIGWPVLLFCLFAIFPQHMLIQLVGLRVAIWYLPILLMGATASLADLTLVARTLAVLNLVSLSFASGEYFLGLERFYPRNEITTLIYLSGDAGNNALRIPGTFSNAAAYGGTMIASIPWLVGQWQRPKLDMLERWFFALALLAAALGVFLCASRSPAILLFIQGAFLVYNFRSKMRYLMPALAIVLVVGYIVSGSDRLQRFTTLQDTDAVEKRIQVSMNVYLLDLLMEYPLGAGLGGAFGTNIPTFLMHLMDKPQLHGENEYVRIGLEQGLVGMVIWATFLVWLFARRRVNPSPDWALGCRQMKVYCMASWGTAFIGCGLLGSIPSTVLLLFQMGILARDRLPFNEVRQPIRQDADWALQRVNAIPV